MAPALHEHMKAGGCLLILEIKAAEARPVPVAVAICCPAQAASRLGELDESGPGIGRACDLEVLKAMQRRHIAISFQADFSC